MLNILLSMIGALGLGVGVWTVWAAVTAPHHNEIGVAMAILYGSIPFAIGVVALGAIAVVLAVERAARDQVYAINRLSEIVQAQNAASPTESSDGEAH